jgi:hypothetical protein
MRKNDRNRDVKLSLVTGHACRFYCYWRHAFTNRQFGLSRDRFISTNLFVSCYFQKTPWIPAGYPKNFVSHGQSSFQTSVLLSNRRKRSAAGPASSPAENSRNTRLLRGSVPTGSTAELPNFCRSPIQSSVWHPSAFPSLRGL